MWWALSSVVIPLIVYYVFVKRAKKIDYRGKHVVLTGGSKGLGLALAERLIKEGAKISIMARTPNVLDKIRENLTRQAEKGGVVKTYVTDVCNYDNVVQSMNACVAEQGVPDFVITCAGYSRPGLFMDCDISIFRNQMETNYFGTVYTIKAALPHMIPKKSGHFVLVSSAAMFVGMIGYSQYAPTKYAVRGLAECLRQELLMYNMKVSIYAPSSIDTPEGFATEQLTKPEITKKLEGTASLLTPEAAANNMLLGLNRGQYVIVDEFITNLLRMTSNGVPPRNYFWLEVLLMPLLPVIEFFINLFWEKDIKSYAKTLKQTSSSSSLLSSSPALRETDSRSSTSST